MNLNLPTPEERRKLKLVMMYKMIHGQVQLKSGNCLMQAALGDIAKDSCSHAYSTIDAYLYAYLYSYCPSAIMQSCGMAYHQSSRAVESPNIARELT